MKPPIEQVRARLQWLVDHNQEDRRVTVGCRDCKESHNLMAGTALVAWLSLGQHETHAVWMKNPFPKRGVQS